MTQQERLEKLFDDFREQIMKEFGQVEPVDKFKPPSYHEVLAYFREKGYRDEVAARAWQYYNAASWKDSRGKQIKNWKQKMIGVWFKPENEAKKINAVDLNNEW